MSIIHALGLAVGMYLLGVASGVLLKSYFIGKAQAALQKVSK